MRRRFVIFKNGTCAQFPPPLPQHWCTLSGGVDNQFTDWASLDGIGFPMSPSGNDLVGTYSGAGVTINVTVDSVLLDGSIDAFTIMGHLSAAGTASGFFTDATYGTPRGIYVTIT